MKGPLASRHTSFRVFPYVRQTQSGSGQLTDLVMHLSELTVSSSSDRIGARCHSENDHPR